MGLFFIDRPVFAWVIAILMMLSGAIAINYLPVEQYPAIAAPTINVTTVFPGASAKLVEDSVIQVIEQRLTGIDNLRYLSSTSDSSGTGTIVLTFDTGTNPDIAQVQVQNKLQLAMPLLPEAVQRNGVVVSKTRANFLMVISFFDRTGTMTELDIGDYISSNMVDSLSRISGIGTVTVFGQQHAMRVWLNPQKLATYKLSVPEVIAAIRAQNAEVSAGQLGDLPALEGQQLNTPIYVQARLETTAQFENILIRADSSGGRVLLSDIARVEMGASAYKPTGRYQGGAAIGVGIQLATGANALKTSDRILTFIEKSKGSFPPGMEIAYPYDTTVFVKLSIKKVVHTLIEAIILVFLVMYLFLQNVRATLIPTIAVPVVLLGTFAVLAVFGFTINMLTMFALVLAIGLLVDDAIIVVENVERLMSEEQLSPREATRKSMQQITGALVAIAAVLSSVFVPMAFFPGATGAIYRQFSITLVSAMLLSVVVAIILTPALCATLLKPHHQMSNKGESLLSRFFRWFNHTFERASHNYEQSTRRVLDRPRRYLMIYGALVLVMGILFYTVPTAFLPDEDQGTMFVQILTPPGATQERTLETVKQVEKYFLESAETKNIGSIFSILGFSFAGSGQNAAIAFVRLKDWSERIGFENSVFAITNRASKTLASIKDAMIFAFAPPAIRELGNSIGFDLELIDQAGLGHAALLDARNKLLHMASLPQAAPYIMGVRPNGLEDAPNYRLSLDYNKIKTLGIVLTEVTSTIQTALGSSYIDDFLDKGRVKRVYVQSDAAFRMLPQNVGHWYVRNGKNEMTALSSLTSGTWGSASPRLERYNGLSSMEILGMPTPGNSTGTAMMVMEKLVKQLPPGIGFDWTGISYEERLAGAQASLLFALSILAIFLCLAALYESWAIPFAVMFVVPFGVFGAVVTAKLFGLANDVYFKVGLLSTIGLSAKNAILIVEFAKTLYAQGMPLLEASAHAARQRLRPILMTSMAFILGITPLALSHGAGAASQNAIGRGMIGGLLSATFLAIFFVPLFFIIIERLIKKSTDSPLTTS